MEFGEVLSKAWKIVWNHKILWVFGILASCGSSSSSNSFQFSGDERFWRSRNLTLPPGLENLERQLNSLQEPAIFALVGIMLCVVILLVILAFFASAFGKAGLILGTSHAEQGASSLSFGELFEGIKPFFWRVVGLNLVILVGSIVLFGGLGLFFAIVAIFTLGIGVICLLPLICLLVPGFWLLSLVIEQATIALILDDLSITQAFQRGWEVFRENIGTMIVMGLILGVGLGIIGQIILGLPIFLIISPMILGAINGSGTAIRNSLLISGICFVVYLPVLIVLLGILHAYIKSAWTLTYLRLTGSKPDGEPAIIDYDEPTPEPES